MDRFHHSSLSVLDQYDLRLSNLRTVSLYVLVNGKVHEFLHLVLTNTKKFSMSG